jgi:hypothetical protein
MGRIVFGLHEYCANKKKAKKQDWDTIDLKSISVFDRDGKIVGNSLEATQQYA